ncbi:unknown protein [Parachlamydia acanthamoebae UV-7]|uniref:Uncharacterized protein n=1 Tax=Parachlamydia acanthamoebae (strain UV7) TaxID=765952 RepID=F8L2F7_PARAV|nr:unknown protein [Parachlamydia acanthamoebae UV-7]
MDAPFLKVVRTILKYFLILAKDNILKT